MNLVAPDVSPLHLVIRKVRADSRRPLRFKDAERKTSFGRILSPKEREQQWQPSEAHSIIERLSAGRIRLPLPKREGWGEGKARHRTDQADHNFPKLL
jgi:hypothetical protein